jgi:hypothetical protein
LFRVADDYQNLFCSKVNVVDEMLNCVDVHRDGHHYVDHHVVNLDEKKVCQKN